MFYGISPAKEKLAGVKAPVMGFYGGNDARVNASIPDAEAEMKRLAKPFTPHMSTRARATASCGSRTARTAPT